MLTTDEIIHNKTFGLGMTTLVFSNEGLNNIMKIIKSLRERGLLVKDTSEIIDNEQKEQKKDGFLGLLLGKSAAS